MPACGASPSLSANAPLTPSGSPAIIPNMNPKPLLGSVWVFENSPLSHHFLLLEEKQAWYTNDEWEFEALEVENGTRQSVYFKKRARAYGGWEEDK